METLTTYQLGGSMTVVELSIGATAKATALQLDRHGALGSIITGGEKRIIRVGDTLDLPRRHALDDPSEALRRCYALDGADNWIAVKEWWNGRRKVKERHLDSAV